MIEQSQLEPIADRIYKAGLAVPAIFMLELHKPLTSIIHTSVSLGAPFVEPFVGSSRYGAISQFFESRESAEQLIQLLEAKLGSRVKAQ